MRNGNFSYHITGLVRSVYHIWEMDNSHITNEDLKIKSLIKHIELVILYFVQHFYINDIYICLARTPEIGQGLGRILSCGARKQEQT